MLLTLKVKLNPTDEQRLKLLSTMETFNAACDDISREAYESRARQPVLELESQAHPFRSG